MNYADKRIEFNETKLRPLLCPLAFAGFSDRASISRPAAEA